MKLILTGGSGFIGNEFLAAVPASTHVLLLNRNRANKRTEKTYSSLFDVTQQDLVGYDLFVHLAGLAHNTSATPSQYTQINTELTIHLAEQAVLAGVKRFIFVSTIGVNGSSSDNLAFCYNSPENPHNYYAKSKYEAELALKKISNDSGLELVIIRPTLVYGAAAPGNFRALKKLVATIPVLPFGSVNNKRSFISVENLANLIYECCKNSNAPGKTFLATDGNAISTKEFANKIAIGMNRKCIQIPVPLPLLKLMLSLIGKANIYEQLCGNLEVDESNLKHVLNWDAPFTIESSMRKIKS